MPAATDCAKKQDKSLYSCMKIGVCLQIILNSVTTLEREEKSLKIIYDEDIPRDVRPSIEEVIKESITAPCECGCAEIYVSLQAPGSIDVKCYDCGTSFFELEIEEEEELSEV